MIATPMMTPTFTANRTTPIAPLTPPTMETVTTLTPTTTLGDDDDDRPTRASLWCNTPHCGGGAYTGLDSLLMPPPPARLSDAAAAATATSSYSRPRRWATTRSPEEEWGRKKSQVSWQSYVGTVEVDDLCALLW